MLFAKTGLFISDCRPWPSERSERRAGMTKDFGAPLKTPDVSSHESENR